MEHSAALRGLKARRDQEERARIRQQLAEDKERRAQQRTPTANAAGEEANAAAPTQSARGSSAAPPNGAGVADVRIRCPDGTTRCNRFAATDTLANVREWFVQTPAEPTPAAQAPRPFVGATQALVPNEMARLGREHFERQTERMREEARRLRAAGPAREQPHAAAEDVALDDAPQHPVFFFVPTPRREYDTEELLRTTTLADAGLVPHGTLMVLRPPREGGAQAAAGAQWPGPAWPQQQPQQEEEEEEEGFEEEGFEEEEGLEEHEDGLEEGDDEEEGEDDDAMEGLYPRDHEAVPLHGLPAHGAGPAGRGPLWQGRALGGSALGGGAAESAATALTPEQIRQARLEALQRRTQPATEADAEATATATAVPARGASAAARAADPPPPDQPPAPAPSEQQADDRVASMRRASALRAAMTRSQAPPEPEAPVATPAHAPAAAPVQPAAAPPAPRAPLDPARQRALEAAEIRARELAAQQQQEQQHARPQEQHRPPKNSVLARAAAAGVLPPACASAGPASPQPPPQPQQQPQQQQPTAQTAAAEGCGAAGAQTGISADERKRRVAAHREAAARRELERERIRRALVEDRNQRFAPPAAPSGGAPMELRPTAAAAAAAPGTAAPRDAALAAGARDAADGGGAQQRVTLRVRLEDGECLCLERTAADTLEQVFAAVAERLPPHVAVEPFGLRVVLPPAEYLSTEPAHRARTLGEAQLAPRATLIVVSSASRGVQRASRGTEALAALAEQRAGAAELHADGGAHDSTRPLAAGLRFLVGLNSDRLDEAALDRLQDHVLGRAEECIPDHAQALDVYLVGPGCASAAALSMAGVRALEPEAALQRCAGRHDFIHFESIDEAVRRGERVVIACETGDASLRSAQAYLAASVRRWLLELKTDGAGALVHETKSVDPITRRPFTREQILAILLFGSSTDATTAPAAGRAAQAAAAGEATQPTQQ